MAQMVSDSSFKTAAELVPPSVRPFFKIGVSCLFSALFLRVGFEVVRNFCQEASIHQNYS
jgi:hypothetical protein